MSTTVVLPAPETPTKAVIRPAGIVKVAEIAKDTATSSENTQHAAEELARLAAELRQLTLQFRYAEEHLDGSSNAPRPVSVSVVPSDPPADAGFKLAS